MERTLAAELTAVPAGSTARVQGWLHRRRTLANITFVVLRDRTGLAQVVVKDPATIAEVARFGEETVLEVTGIVSPNPSAPMGVEILDPVLQPLSEPAQTPPVELWRPNLTAGLPTLLDHAPVTLRHPRSKAAWQLASASMAGFREALAGNGFTEISTPKLVGASTESGANVFTVDYFGRPAYLAQSPQLYKQILVGVFERVFEVGPVFRAEPHDTVRHIAEYVSLDAELGFIRDHRDVLTVLRAALAGMVQSVTAQAPTAVELLDVRLPEVPEEIPVVHFADALRLVRAPEDEPDLAPEHERALSAWAWEEHRSE
ncbi:MAG: amino acid--tRNA ligase-related protein, partial [Nocardioidaceae bacterium]